MIKGAGSKSWTLLLSRLGTAISDVQDFLNIYLKKHGGKAINPSIRIYVNKIENRIMFKIKTGYCIKL